MAKRGICWLCGQETDQLTADHIQPQCAFNEKKRKHVRFANVTNRFVQPNAFLTGPTVRNIYREIQPDRPIAGGIYRFRQCKVCNERLGRLYDARFGQWCRDSANDRRFVRPGRPRFPDAGVRVKNEKKGPGFSCRRVSGRGASFEVG
jgi:hypothetical protein